MITRPFSSIELARAVRRACLLCANLLRCCCPRTRPACDHVATQHQANIFFTLHTALFTPCTSRFTLALHIRNVKSSDFFSPHVTSSDLFSSDPIPSHMSSKQVLLSYFHVIRALRKVHLNSSQLLCTPEISYRQSLRKALPSTTSSTKLAQSTSCQALLSLRI